MKIWCSSRAIVQNYSHIYGTSHYFRIRWDLKVKKFLIIKLKSSPKMTSLFQFENLNAS